MKQRNLAILTLEYPPRVLGGAGVVITRIAEGVARRGWAVHVLTPGTGDGYRYAVEKGVHVHWLPAGPLPRWNVPFFWIILPYWFRKISADVRGFALVHGNGIADLTLRRVAESRPRIVTVHHLASTVVKILKPTLRERLRRPGDEIGLGPVWESVCIRRADWITTVSEFCRSDIVSSLGVDPGIIRVIVWGTELEGYRFSSEALAGLRKDLGADGRPMILCVGRLEPRKGIAGLIDAFSILASRRDAVLVVAGSGEPEEYRRRAARRGVGDNVVFTGTISSSSELRMLYAACDLVAIPSLFEGLGLTALEARAAGKFTVACRTGGLPEVVPDGSGYLVPPGDPHAFSQAMEKALDETHPAIAGPRSWNETEMDYYHFYEEAASGRGAD